MFNLYNRSKKFIAVLNTHKQLIDILNIISAQRKAITINPMLLISGNVNANLIQVQHQIQRTNSVILEIIRQIRPNEFFTQINQFITDLNLADSSYNDTNSLIIELKLLPDNHTDAYSERQADLIFTMTENCYAVSKHLESLKEQANLIIYEFENTKHEIPENYSSINIGTDQDVPIIEDFIKILNSLEDLYNFIAIIYKVDPKENPVIINSIHTGSWYTDLLGIKQVVISIENLLKGIGLFIRDIITGKITRERFENECKKAEAFINLIDKANESGIDNAALGIFKGLNPLIDIFMQHTTNIDINGEEILKLKKTEKLTLLKQKKERELLVEKINLSLGCHNDQGREENQP